MYIDYNENINNSPARISLSTEDLKKGFIEHLKYSLGRPLSLCDSNTKYVALAYTIRDRIMDRWFRTKKTHEEKKIKFINYFSFEFLLGRALFNNITNLGIRENIDSMLKEINMEWDEILSTTADQSLGNGGLGRLAACFMDSLATMEIPAYGYGLRYKYGFFKQVIKNGYQIEEADNWLKNGNPWEIVRNDIRVKVKIGGRVVRDTEGNPVWTDTQEIIGTPYDIPIIGYDCITVNTLRLWDSTTARKFDYQEFNKGEYNYVDKQAKAESLTNILYPNDNIYSGKELRFKQQYFFVSCSLQDIMRRFRDMRLPLEQFPDKMAIQLNDTHPAIAVAELMRIFIDEEKLSWDAAWDITTRTFGYTNHTLMPEALETWPVSMFEKLLPRHLEIIYMINHFFLQKIAGLYPNDMEKMTRVSLVKEGKEKRIKMAYLAIVGSHSVNGVSDIHSKLLKEKVLPDFYQIFPEKFNNKTNGITPRIWLMKANPLLAGLITESIGKKWITDLDELSKLKKFADDPVFLEKLDKIKRANKVKLSNHCMREYGIELDPDSIFDMQTKRIHEYKRQLLNAMNIIDTYSKVKRGEFTVPKTFIISGKAAPGYDAAKMIIKLIYNISRVINNDKDTNQILKVHFLPNYSVTLAEYIFPAADISEQISTAGTEASGTGNMKFMLNGAITIGTLDGANIEILKETGEENMFIFGLKTDEIEEVRKNYDPRHLYESDMQIKNVMDYIIGNFFNISEPGIFDSLISELLNTDHYMHFADLPSFIEAHKKAVEKYLDRTAWLKSSLMNIASSGKFSSDRTIKEYSREIWNVSPCHVEK